MRIALGRTRRETALMALPGLTQAHTAERTPMPPDTINEMICRALGHRYSRLSAESCDGMHYEQEDQTGTDEVGALMQHLSPDPPMVVDHDDPDAIAEVAAAYALDALSANETRQVTDHLPGCVKCHEEVARMREAAGVLAYAAEAAPLPDGLRQKVLDRSRSLSTGPSGMDVSPEQT